ncbi:MAG: DUF4203 domain-containing protein [Candidatus Krumholzibacteriota bacterium]|nr:DUF4203 domain-containing protein [Candidatus Krumholzibacteriota bacterium]
MAISVPFAVAAAISVVVGLVMCFRGYRAFRAILGIVGFAAGAWLAAALVMRTAAGGGLAVFFAALVGGLVGAALVTALYPVGVFLLGAMAGWLVGSLVAGGTGLALLLPIVAAILGGLLAFAFQRLVIVVATAIAGSWHVIAGALCLAGRPIDPFSVYTMPGRFARFHGSDATILVVIWALLAAAGIAAQYRTHGARFGRGKGTER